MPSPDLATPAAKQYRMQPGSKARDYARIEQILAEMELRDRDAYNKQEQELVDTIRRVHASDEGKPRTCRRQR